MKTWVTKPAVNLSNVRSRGLATLGVGVYFGYFIGATQDSGEKQWVTVSCSQGAHTEMTSIDVSKLTPHSRIKFEITAQDGAVALMNGNKYKLMQDEKELTDWLDLSELMRYIKDTGTQLAEPKLKWIEAQDG